MGVARVLYQILIILAEKSTHVSDFSGRWRVSCPPATPPAACVCNCPYHACVCNCPYHACVCNCPYHACVCNCPYHAGLVYWGLTPQQQPGSYQGGEMMMKPVFWWRKPEYPEETTDLRQVTDETFSHIRPTMHVVTCRLYTPLHYRKRGQGSSAALHMEYTDGRSLYQAAGNRAYHGVIAIGHW